MKNLRKVLALVLACAMMFGTIAVVSAKTFPDVKVDATYAESVSLLSALKIIDGDTTGNFNPDKTITRAEFAKVLAVALGATSVSPVDTKFTDVTKAHWASGYIAFANQLGIINGYDAATFGPEDPVTYEQAIKMIVVAIGHGQVAISNGGYPTGYLMVAADQQITKNATGKVGDPAVRSTVAVLLANGINTPVMERVKYGTTEEYAVMDGTNGYSYKTLLNTKLNTYKVEATVTANDKTNMVKNGSVNKVGLVSIDITNYLSLDVNKVFSGLATLTGIKANASGADKLVGQSVVAYLYENTVGDFEVFSASPKAGKNVTISIKDGQCFDPSKDTSVRPADQTNLMPVAPITPIFAYWEVSRDTDTRIKTIDVLPTATLMFNGVSQGTLAQAGAVALATSGANSMIKPSTGTVDLVDIDNDGSVDIINVKSYSTVVVDTVDTNRINFSNSYKAEGTASFGSIGGSISFDTYKNTKLNSWTITKAGVAIDVKDIAKSIAQNDIVNFCTDNYADPTYYDIIVTSSKITGTVTEFDSSAGKYTIEGKQYKLNELVDSSSVALQDKGDFYLDMRGKVAYVDTVSTANNSYAYLDKMGANSMGDLQMRMFNYEGKDMTLNISSNVKINDVSAASQVLTTPYALADIQSIFAGTPAAAVAGTTVGNLMATYGGYPAATLVTPTIFLQALTNATINGFTAPTFNATVMASLAGSYENNKLVTYTADSTSITGISLALNRPNDDKVFNFAGSYPSVEYKAALTKFASGKAITDSTIVFYIPYLTKTISDYEVRKVSSLTDAAIYSPLFYGNNSTNGAGAVVLYADPGSLPATASEAVFNKSTTGKDADNNDVNKLYVWQDGAAVAAPLVAVKNEVTVTGAKTSINALTPGDVFIYNVNSKGNVDTMQVLFAPGIVQALYPTDLGYSPMEFANKINVAGVEKDWKPTDTTIAQNPLYATADSEIYFGYVYKKTSVAAGVKVSIVGPDGTLDNSSILNGEKDFIVPSTAKVVVYNPTLGETRKISAGTIGDIMVSTFIKQKIAGNTIEAIDFAQTVKDDLKYAYIRMYKGAVTEVVVVDYAVQ